MIRPTGYNGIMNAKEPPANTYGYAAVETALALVFRVDAAGQRGWFRARIQNFRRLGLTPAGPGKGKTISYSLEDIDRWLIALEMEHFVNPVVTVNLVKTAWDRDDDPLRDLVKAARAAQRADDEILVTVEFRLFSSTEPILGVSTMKGLGSLGRWLRDYRDGPRRSALFNLSSRLHALDEALVEAAKSEPPPPTGRAKAIPDAGKRRRGEIP
jgi:hypothetical protein